MDKEVYIGHSKVQHGKVNDRVFLKDYQYEKDPYLLNQLHLMAKTYQYGKIIAKTPPQAKEQFTKYAFEEEAYIPAYFNGEVGCYFMAKYCRKERKRVRDKSLVINNLKRLNLTEDRSIGDLNEAYYIRQLTFDDIDRMVAVYKDVFSSVSFPIHESSYIEKTMEEDTRYYGVFYKEKDELIGISSCEINRPYQNVKMANFAILLDHRGKRLAKQLLVSMEDQMKKLGIKTAYTSVFSQSLAMNEVFSRAGYYYGGTLWNNAQFAGKAQSTNVWHKPLYLEEIPLGRSG